MKAVKTTFKNGQITFAEPLPAEGPVDVSVVFSDPADDPWQQILRNPAPRPALARWIKEVEEESAQGQASSLDVNQL